MTTLLVSVLFPLVDRLHGECARLFEDEFTPLCRLWDWLYWRLPDNA